MTFCPGVGSVQPHHLRAVASTLPVLRQAVPLGLHDGRSQQFHDHGGLAAGAARPSTLLGAPGSRLQSRLHPRTLPPPPALPLLPAARGRRAQLPQ